MRVIGTNVIESRSYGVMEQCPLKWLVVTSNLQSRPEQVSPSRMVIALMHFMINWFNSSHQVWAQVVNIQRTSRWPNPWGVQAVCACVCTFSQSLFQTIYPPHPTERWRICWEITRSTSMKTGHGELFISRGLLHVVETYLIRHSTQALYGLCIGQSLFPILPRKIRTLV